MSEKHPRLRREAKTIETMLAIYCAGQHSAGHDLCLDCQQLRDYALERLNCCPFQEKKSTCVNCAVHCYKPAMREKVRAAMRYSGPRMLFRHPVLAIFHLLDGFRKTPALSGRTAAPRDISRLK